MNIPNWFDTNLASKISLPHKNDKFKTIDNYPFKYTCNRLNKTTKFKLKEKQVDDLEKKILNSKEKAINTINNSNKNNKETLIKSMETRYNKKIANINRTTKTIKWKLNFNNEQNTTLLEYFNRCNKFYNYCVDLYKKKPKIFNESYSKIKVGIFESFYKDKEKDVPYDTLTDEVRIFCSNLKSCKSNLKNNNIKNFTMHHIDSLKYKSILISKKSITPNGIFPNILGKNNINNISKIISILNNKHECKLRDISDSRLKYNGKEFYLYLPIYSPKKIIEKREKVVALDPGEAKFMSFYGTKTYGHLGINMRHQILKHEAHIRKYQRILSKKENKDGDKLKHCNKIKSKIQHHYNKIKNIVKELHNHTALYLSKNYDNILIPKFETQKMVGKPKKIIINEIYKKYENKDEAKEQMRKYERKRRLNGRVKFVLMRLSHYKFRQHLNNKCIEYGCEIHEVTEEFTSKTCTYCGYISNTFNKRIKECEECKERIDRDICGGRNILIKNIKKLL